MKQFFRFGIVGTIGFIVDASILYLLVKVFLLDISISRLISFIFAVLVTWLLNRNFTFNQEKRYSKKKEYSFYLTIQTIGGLLNYLIFILLVKNSYFFEDYLILALAIASIITMFFNFFLLKRKVYNSSN